MILKRVLYRVFLIFPILFIVLPCYAQTDDKYLVSVSARAYGLYAKGKYDQAFLVYKRAINIHPEYAPLYDGIGSVYLKKGQYNEAYMNYKAANKLDPSNSLYKVHAQEAVYLSNINMLDSAKSYLTKALSLSPNNQKIKDNINKVTKNDYQNLTLISDYYADPTDKSLMQGNLAWQAKDYKKATDFYIKVIKAKKNSYKAYNNLGLLSIDMDNVENAIKYFNKSISQNPSAAYAYNNLGAICYSKNDFKQAAKYFDLAISANNKYPSSLNNKAVYLFNLATKSLDQSISYLETIVKYEPNNIRAVKLLKLFYVLDNNHNSETSTN